MWLVTEEEKPLASLKFVGLATSGEGDQPGETINRDRALYLVTGHLMALVDHHSNGLEHCFFNEWECLGHGQRRSLGSEIYWHTRIGMLRWVGIRHVRSPFGY